MRKNNFYNLEVLNCSTKLCKLVMNKIPDGTELVHLQSSNIKQLIIDKLDDPNDQLHCISILIKIKADQFQEYCTDDDR